MAEYLGYALQAGVQGFQTGMNLAQKKSEMDWQKKQRKKLEEKELKIKEGASVLNNLAQQLSSDGYWSDDDIMKWTTAWLAAGHEIQEITKGSNDAITKMKNTEWERDLELLDLWIDMTNNADPKDIQGSFDMIQGIVQSEKSLGIFDAYFSLQKKKYEVTPQVEKYSTVAGVQEAHPEAGYKYTDEGYVPTFQKEEAPKEPTFNEKRFNWKIEQRRLGNITTDQFLKSEGMYIAPERMSALEKEIELIIKYGGTNEEIKNKLLQKGGGGTTLTPTPTSVENIRKDIKNAPTLADAKRIEKNHIAKYGDTTGIANVEKFWSEERVNRLTSLKQDIDKLLDENKRLKKGTISSTEIISPIEEGEYKIEVMYEDLREEYMKYRKMLEKMGIDLSQFPRLMSYEEYMKSDVKPGKGLFYPSTWGKQKPPIY